MTPPAKKLVRTWNLLIFILTPLVMRTYHLESETKQLIIILVLIHNIFNSVVFPFAGPLSNGLRAAGDVKFTMFVSIASTVMIRLVFSVLFGMVLNLGVIGIAYAMLYFIMMITYWIEMLLLKKRKSGNGMRLQDEK